MVIFAGRDSSQNYFNDLYALDLQTRKVLGRAQGRSDSSATDSGLLPFGTTELSVFVRSTVAAGPNQRRCRLLALPTKLPHMLPAPRLDGDLWWQ